MTQSETPNFKPDREHTFHIVAPDGEILHRCFSAQEARDVAEEKRAIMWRTPILNLYPDVLIQDFSEQSA